MVSPDACQTIYADWKGRRNRLGQASESDSESVRVQRRVFEYLLNRYRDSERAQRLVACSTAHRLVIDDRALVVNHHLSIGSSTVIASPQMAGQHVKSVLGRMFAGKTLVTRSIVFTPEESREAERNRIRLRLASSNSLTRIHAVLRLGRRGALTDIGLIDDLLALPATKEEHPREREAYVRAMARLAGLQNK